MMKHLFIVTIILYGISCNTPHSKSEHRQPNTFLNRGGFQYQLIPSNIDSIRKADLSQQHLDSSYVNIYFEPLDDDTLFYINNESYCKKLIEIHHLYLLPPKALLIFAHTKLKFYDIFPSIGLDSGDLVKFRSQSLSLYVCNLTGDRLAYVPLIDYNPGKTTYNPLVQINMKQGGGFAGESFNAPVDLTLNQFLRLDTFKLRKNLTDLNNFIRSKQSN